MKINTTFVKTLAVLALMAAPVAAFAQLNQASANPQGSGFFTNLFGCTGAAGGSSNVVCILRAVLMFILSIAFIVAVIFLVIGGFRYITSQGNEEGIEKAKGTITNAIIGIVVIVLAWIILTIVLNLVSSGTAGT
jgi:hypothetical protein